MRVVIEKLDHFGRGICYINHKICFVLGALPEEEVEIEIIKENKKHILGKVVSILKKSPMRIDSICPYFNLCGGCQLQHLSYEDENIYKENKVKEIMEHFAFLPSNIILPIVYHEKDYYRNKILLHGSPNGLGLYKNESHEVIPIKKCILVLPRINKMISLLQNKNINECLIKCSNLEDQVLVDLKGNIDNIETLKQDIDVFTYNKELLSSKSSIFTNIGNTSYYQDSSSFFQVNATLTKDLYDEVYHYVEEIKPKQLLDLYCGCGTIGIYVRDCCSSIIGIDSNLSNISNARENAKINQCNNITFYCDKVENKIQDFMDSDFVIVDPPRAGLDSYTKDILKQIKPKAIVYVSCDPVTLARDLKDLGDFFQVHSIKPFNMFPRTYHVECVTFLTYKG